MIGMRDNHKAAMLAVGTVALSSFFSPLVGLFGTESPFLFAAFWRAGGVLALAVYVLLAYRAVVFDRRVWAKVANRIMTWGMIFWSLEAFNPALFAWSASLVEVAITTVLYETWPIMLIIVTGRLFGGKRYRRNSMATLFSFAVAMVGVTMVIGSQSGEVGFEGVSFYAVPAGIALAVGAAVFNAMSGFGFRWGADMAETLSTTERHDTRSLEMFGIIVGVIVVNTLAIPLLVGVSVTRGEPYETSMLLVGLIAAPVLNALPTILWRKSNLITDNLGVNVILYFRPLAALGLLYAFSLTSEVNMALLLFGAIIIVAGNIGVFLDEHEYNRSRSRAVDVDAMVTAGESESVEFKSTLRTNLDTYEHDKEIELSALKALTAFLNTRGGTLLVGIADDRFPIGTAIDGFDSEDAMSLHLRTIVDVHMGAGAMAYIHPSFDSYRGKQVMVVQCEPSHLPVFLKNENMVEEFCIRAGPASTKLSVRDSHEYIRHRFSG